MHTGGLGGATTSAFGVDLAEAGDVLGHGAGEQLDVLRQVADVLAEHVLVPLAVFGAVDSHRAVAQRPHTGQCAGQGRLAAGRGADDRHALSSLEAERDPLDRRTGRIGRQDHRVGDLDVALRRRQGGGRFAERERLEHAFKAVEGGRGRRRCASTGRRSVRSARARGP